MRSGAPQRHAEINSSAKRVSQARKQVGSWVDRLAQQTREHPGRSVAMAVGVGYVLGGGLFSRLTARVLGMGVRIGLRTALLPFVTEGLVALGQRHTKSEGDVNDETQRSA
jgi:hypothetical protein